MISIALVLILVLGINAVFKMAADTVGTGQVLSAKTRDGRAAQAVFNQDLSHLVQQSDQPFFIIDSRTQLAFRNAADQQADLDGNPATIDLNGNNIEGEATVAGEQVNLATASLRNHRVDTLSFFARDLFARVTGNSSGANQAYVDPLSSNEAWITYGHLRVYDGKSSPNMDGSYLPLGAGPPPPSPQLTAQTNPNNFYADQWVLGRKVMLLVKPNAGAIVDRAKNPQYYWWGGPDSTSLKPLDLRSNSNDPANSSVTISDGRYDLIGTSIGNFKTILKTYMAQAGNFPDWWRLLPCNPDITTNRPPGFPTVASMPYGRFRCNPNPGKPLTPFSAAMASPILLDNCTQFIVEFAGDYLTQDPLTGNITAIAPDGVTDFFYDHPNDKSEPNMMTGPAVRRIRWYGFPRDLNGNGHITSYKAGLVSNQLVDVVPVRDVVMTVNPTYYTATNALAFERHIAPNPADPNQTLKVPAGGDYAAPGAVSANDYYTAAWGPDDTNRPKMIRIIMTVDDPAGRLSDGQTFEYVINLP